MVSKPSSTWLMFSRPGHNRDAIERINVGGTANVLDACAEAGLSHILYLSSTSVYGAHPENPALLTEESPTRPVKGFQYSEDKVRSEGLINEYTRRSPDFKAAILRVCPIMGPNADNFIAHAFSKHLPGWHERLRPAHAVHA